MSSDSEFLYPGESSGSESLKVVRLARRVREMRIKTPQAHAAVVGLLSTRILMFTTEEMEKERGRMKDILWSARMKLMQCGLGEDGVRVYVPYKCAPIEQPGIVVLYALDMAPPRTGPYMWDRQPRIQTAVGPELEASLNMEYDAKARDADEKREDVKSYLTCQIEVALWDAKTNTRQVQLMPGAKLTLKVGANSIEEVTAEIEALKLKLRALKIVDKITWGTISKVEISLKGEAGLEFKRQVDGTAERLLKEWQAKMKLSLAADLRIPGTSIKLPIEITPYVDAAGKTGVEFQIKILDW